MKTKLFLISFILFSAFSASLTAQTKAKTVQCKAITKKGVQCKRMTSNANGLCYQHQPKKQATVLSKEPVMGGYKYKIHGAEDAPENWFTLVSHKDYKVGQVITTTPKDSIY